MLYDRPLHTTSGKTLMCLSIQSLVSQCILTPIKRGDYVRSGPQCAIVIRGLCSGTPIRSVWSHPHPDKAQLTNSLQVSRCKVLGDLPWLSTRFFALIDNLDEKKLCIFASLNFMTVREGVVCEIKERNYKEGIQRNRQDFFHPASFILLGSAPSWGVHNRWAHNIGSCQFLQWRVLW